MVLLGGLAGGRAPRTPLACVPVCCCTPWTVFMHMRPCACVRACACACVLALARSRARVHAQRARVYGTNAANMAEMIAEI